MAVMAVEGFYPGPVHGASEKKSKHNVTSVRGVRVSSFGDGSLCTFNSPQRVLASG